VCDAGLFNFVLIGTKSTPALFATGVFTHRIALLFNPGFMVTGPFSAVCFASGNLFYGRNKE
jgi:hypothetical protein